MLPPGDRLGPPQIRRDERASPCEKGERRQQQAEHKTAIEQARDLVDEGAKHEPSAYQPKWCADR